jgi:hypothetical protein
VILYLFGLCWYVPKRDENTFMQLNSISKNSAESMPKAKRQSSLLVFFSVLSSMVHYYRQPHRNHSTSSIRNLKVVTKKIKNSA